MSLRSGREFLSIPGPTTVPDQVLQAMQRPAVDIYWGPLVALTDGLVADLARIFRTQPGQPMIRVDYTHFDKNGAPLLLGQTFCRADRFVFEVDLPGKTGRPARRK